MPDPDATATAKLYSQEFYLLARRALAPGGRLVVQAGSPYFAPRTFDCVLNTIRAAGLGATPYHVNVPTFGDWGFVLAQDGRAAGPAHRPARAAALPERAARWPRRRSSPPTATRRAPSPRPHWTTRACCALTTEEWQEY